MTDSKKKQRMLYICRRMPHTPTTHPSPILFCPFLYRFVRPFFCLQYFVVSHIQTHVGSCSSQFTTKTLQLCVNVFLCKVQVVPPPHPWFTLLQSTFIFHFVSSMSPHTHAPFFCFSRLTKKEQKIVSRHPPPSFSFIIFFLLLFIFSLPSSVTSWVCVCGCYSRMH